MKELSENPNINALLLKNGLEIYNGITAAQRIDTSDNIEAGDILPEGTVIGFHLNGRANEIPLLAIIYDESKEGKDDALKTINCVF